MKINIDLSEQESTRLSNYLHARWGARTHGKKTKLLHDALIAFLDREEKSMASPTQEKKIVKKDKPPVSREGEPRRPRIADDPALVRKIDEMLSDGKNIADIANEIGYAWSTIKSYLAKR